MDIAPDHIQVIGYAEYRPVASNETPEGRRANRRVEVIVSKDSKTENKTPFYKR
jgi:chemotaxis protein MotB